MCALKVFQPQKAEENDVELVARSNHRRRKRTTWNWLRDLWKTHFCIDTNCTRDNMWRVEPRSPMLSLQGQKPNATRDGLATTADTKCDWLGRMPSRTLPSIESKMHSVLVSWDFGAAFPSIAWQFLFAVVRHMSLLHGFHEVVCGMYHMTVSLLIQVSSLELYSIISSRGYKSGRCMNAIRCFAEFLQSCVHERFPLTHYWSKFADLFIIMERACGRAVKPRECSLVPLWASLTLHIVNIVRSPHEVWVSYEWFHRRSHGNVDSCCCYHCRHTDVP